MLLIHPRRSPLLAAAASALLPGAGQALAGRPRRAVLQFATVLLLVGLAAAVVASGLRPRDLAFALLRPEVLVVILVLDALAWAWRSATIIDAWQLVQRASAGGRLRHAAGIAALTVLLAVSTLPHLAIGAIDEQALDTLTSVFAAGGPADDGALAPPPEVSASPTPSPTAGSTSSSGTSPTATPSLSLAPTPTPTPPPSPTPAWALDGRLNLLLVGSDAGPDRWQLRTDTMILLSVEVATGRSTLFGIPRNMKGVPLPAPPNGPGGTYPGLLNSLYVYAVGHPDLFPGGPVRGYRAVEGAVATLAGLRVDGMVLVNLAGFVRLVDALGGLDIDIPAPLHDSNYPLEDGSGWIVLDFQAGPQHLDGRMALAYARSRHQDSDYGRMARQQLVLVALRRDLRPCALVPRISGILAAIKGTFWTDLPLKDLPALLGVAARVNPATVRTVLFVPPRYPEVLDPATIARIRAVVAVPFLGPAPSTAPSGGGGWGC